MARTGKDTDVTDSFGVRLSRTAAGALDALRRKGLPRGATPVPKGHIVERAILALAEAEGIGVGGGSGRIRRRG